MTAHVTIRPGSHRFCRVPGLAASQPGAATLPKSSQAVRDQAALRTKSIGTKVSKEEVSALEAGAQKVALMGRFPKYLWILRSATPFIAAPSDSQVEHRVVMRSAELVLALCFRKRQRSAKPLVQPPCFCSRR